MSLSELPTVIVLELVFVGMLPITLQVAVYSPSEVLHVTVVTCKGETQVTSPVEETVAYRLSLFQTNEVPDGTFNACN